uniref:glyceraldehyde-3-phosphate dehydrogenase (NADP(+)) (phosphorylating) n=2 Tax=Mucochytrium quahogii TaxID=96639 RepID=A0A7S2RW06_9STRA|mmetsp:Transcript_1193/g.1419  ORF Transcript_1193/g.1419 Transcript_1193/m.1419 type:complete len:505 (-) Transcript_1193:1105-2619(-)
MLGGENNNGEAGEQVGQKRSWVLTRRGSAYEEELNSHLMMERAAVKLAAKVGELLYDYGVELVLFRKHLIDATTPEIINLHKYAAKVVKRPVDVFTTSKLAEALCQLDLGPSKLDIGRLADEYVAEQAKDHIAFLKGKLSSFTKDNQQPFEARDVILYGFGRIGRLAARELIKQAGKGQQLRLRAIVTRDKRKEDIVKRASLFQNDSVHGAFKGTVDVDVETQTLCLEGQLVKMISANNPEDIDYTEFGIKNALVIDNTGVFRDKEALSRHLKAQGVSKVLLTAPGAGIPNVVYGINQGTMDVEKENIFSAASCTTNAIAPVLQIITENFGVERGHIETIHAYTNDQNLLDNFHKKNRRGRSAAINMVITETGAAKAVPKVIASLKDKLTANAVRVPTPNASLAILNLQLDKETTAEEVNNKIREATLGGSLVAQIYFSLDPELVSNDVIGNECCSVFDSHATLMGKDPKNVILYVWYDNEFGYTKQVIRIAKYVTKVRRKVYF